MKTYTENELKAYFEYLQENFKNCPFNEAVWQVQNTMFDKERKYNIDAFLAKKGE